MLSDNNLWQFLLAFLPALFYSYIIYFNDRNNIKWGTTLSYILGGFVSITFLEVLLKIFPRYQDSLFTISNGAIDLTTLSLMQEPTMLTWILYAFLQVAFLEETTKAMAWGAMSLFRKGEYNKRDTLFSTMFYCCMISVGFAGLENLQYMLKFPQSDIFLQRALTAVIAHMICGLMMGYFIAMSRLRNDLFQSLGYKFLGLLSAALFHGTYDFLAMRFYDVEWPLHALGQSVIIRPFYISMVIGLIIVTIFGRNLLGYSLRYGKVQRRRNPLLPEA